MLAVEELEQIVGRLRALARDGGTMDAVQIKIIGLDEIREAAGSNWPRLRDRVRDGSMRMLSQRLGENDVVLPAGDGFLVILAEGEPAGCERRCEAMRRALLEFYLGEDALAALRPELTRARLGARSRMCGFSSPRISASARGSPRRSAISAAACA